MKCLQPLSPPPSGNSLRSAPEYEGRAAWPGSHTGAEESRMLASRRRQCQLLRVGGARPCRPLSAARHSGNTPTSIANARRMRPVYAELRGRPRSGLRHGSSRWRRGREPRPRRLLGHSPRPRRAGALGLDDFSTVSPEAAFDARRPGEAGPDGPRPGASTSRYASEHSGRTRAIQRRGRHRSATRHTALNCRAPALVPVLCPRCAHESSFRLIPAHGRWLNSVCRDKYLRRVTRSP